MANFKIENCNHGFHLNIQGGQPNLLCRAEEGGFCLQFEIAGETTVEIELDAGEFQVLGVQCVAWMPELSPRYAIASVEEAHRLPASILKHYDQISIQKLLREIDRDTMIDFLWYMADRELMRLFMHNLSGRVAGMVLEEINLRWRGKNPDQAIEYDAKRGRKAVLTIMAVVARMVRNGELPDLLGNVR